LVADLIGDFADTATKSKYAKEQQKRRKLDENFGLHWTSSEKVTKGQCSLCGRGSSTTYECYQCKTRLYPCYMAAYHKWNV